MTRNRPVPPDPMPLWRDGRPRKLWRYVGVYGPELSLCLGSVRVGPAVQSFWAVWDRRRDLLTERTVLGRGGVSLGTPGQPADELRVRAHNLRLDLRVREDDRPVTLVSPHGRSYIWTRKAPALVTGTVALDGRELAVRARGLVDDSAGYHARDTEWRWCAGVGLATDGQPVTWNLVAGVHDVEPLTERTVWTSGMPHPVPPVRFSTQLDQLTSPDGGDLRFVAEAVRRRDERVLGGLVRSEYVQPFGVFTGRLPGGLELAEGFGVMEWHLARW